MEHGGCVGQPSMWGGPVLGDSRAVALQGTFQALQGMALSGNCHRIHCPSVHQMKGPSIPSAWRGVSPCGSQGSTMGKPVPRMHLRGQGGSDCLHG